MKGKAHQGTKDCIYRKWQGQQKIVKDGRPQTEIECRKPATQQTTKKEEKPNPNLPL